MVLPVILDTFQVTLVWVNGDVPRPATNVLHFTDTVGGQTEANLSTDLAANVSTGMWTAVGQHSIINRVDIIKLDGVSATHSFNIVAAAKWTGQGATDIVAQGCMVVSLKSNVRGRSGRNRVYLPWIGETQQTNGAFVPSVVTDTATAWATFVNDMAASGWDLVVVSPKESAAHGLATIIARPNVLTQRRRARR